MISVIYTIHNKAELVPMVLSGIERGSVAIKELIIVLDGCTDNSEQKVRDHYHDGLDPFYDLKILHADNVFETRANNMALKEVTQPYAVIIQDDCVLQENQWDKRLLLPFEFFNVFAVSGRNAHNLSLTNNPEFPLDYPDCTGWGTELNDRRTFYIRQVVNRGPLMLFMDAVKELGYFNEEIYRQNGDDHLLCLDAYSELRYRCGNFVINFESRPEWGSTRRPEAQGWINKCISHNQKLIVSKYKELIKERWDQDIRIGQ